MIGLPKTTEFNKRIHKQKFYENMDIEKTVDHLESNGWLFIFWFFWIILIAGCVYGFYYIDNKWLE